MRLLVFSLLFVTCFSAYPIAVIHGIGDFCWNPGLSSFVNYLGAEVGVQAECVESGGSLLDFFTSFRYQARKACENIKRNPLFQSDFSIVGLSQGALIARFIIEECEMPGRVRRYISIGGPQRGVAAVPHCEKGIFCDALTWLVDRAVYFSPVQSIVGPAGYFHDYSNEEHYLQGSTFLPDLNNEKAGGQAARKQRFLELEETVLIKFSADTMIIPRETAWFQFYTKDRKIEELEDSRLYKEDLIGLRSLVEQGKVRFVELEGDHLQFDHGDIDEFMVPALK